MNNGTLALSGTAGGFVPASASLGTDLSNDHPLSFARSPADSQVQDPTAGDAVQLERGTNYIQCVTCHDPHREDAVTVSRKFLVKSNARSGLCKTCHVKAAAGWAWSTSPHATSTKTFTSANTGGTAGLGAHTGYTTVADNACESCHRSHSAPQAQRLVKSVNQRNVCFQCHGSTPVAQKNLATVFAKARSHPLEASTVTMLHDYVETSPGMAGKHPAVHRAGCADRALRARGWD